MRNFIFSVVIFLLSGFISISQACSAKNDVGDTCETNCSAGQVASCSNGTGASAPTCSCANTFVFPEQVTVLPTDQQEAIRKVLIKSNLITEAGQVTKFTEDSISKKHKDALNTAINSIGIKQDQKSFNTLGFFNPGCLAARIAEGVAVAACASVPGGQLAIAACIAAAHEAANQACH